MAVYGVRLKTGEDIFFTLSEQKQVDFTSSAIKAKNVVEFVVQQMQNGEVRFALLDWCPYFEDNEYRWLKTDMFVFEPQEIHEKFRKEYEKKFSNIILPSTSIVH